jgi:hypothetical protein
MPEMPDLKTMQREMQNCRQEIPQFHDYGNDAWPDRGKEGAPARPRALSAGGVEAAPQGDLVSPQPTEQDTLRTQPLGAVSSWPLLSNWPQLQTPR